jgi:hypothetical protein
MPWTLPEAIAELEKYAAWEPPESPRAAAILRAVATMKEANEATLALIESSKNLAEKTNNLLQATAPATSTETGTLDDPGLQGHAYATQYDSERKVARLALYMKPDKKKLLGYILLSTPEVYDMAQNLLDKYDKMEGIE